MIIDAFKNKIIPLADGSYPQYFEESNTDWVEKLDEFAKFLKYLKLENLLMI